MTNRDRNRCEFPKCEETAVPLERVKDLLLIGLFGEPHLCSTHFAESVAYHQAAHVVVAAALGHEYADMQFDPRNPRCQVPPRAVQVRSWVSTGADHYRQRSDAEVNAASRHAWEPTALVAFLAADDVMDRYLGAPRLDDINTLHNGQAIPLFGTLFGRFRRIDQDGRESFEGASIELQLKRGHLRAQSILAQAKHWRAVQSLAAALLERGTLDAAEVRQIVESARKIRTAPPHQAKPTKLSPLVERQLREILGGDW